MSKINRALAEIKKRFQKTVTQFMNSVLLAAGKGREVQRPVESLSHLGSPVSKLSLFHLLSFHLLRGRATSCFLRGLPKDTAGTGEWR